MHYVICYDIRDDRLRDRAAKLLERNGCLRAQKSVFAAPDMHKKDLTKLQLGLRRLFARHPLAPGDSLCVIPLRDEYVADIGIFGENTVLPTLGEKKWKEIL